MTKKFKHIDPPYGFRDFYSKYPHGYSIYEALLEWVQQVNDLTDVVGNLPDNLKTYTEEQLQEWLENGTLENIINEELLNDKADKTEVEKITQLKNLESVNILQFQRDPLDNDFSYLISRALETIDPQGGGHIIIPKQPSSYVVTSPIVSEMIGLTLEFTGGLTRVRLADNYIGDSVFTFKKSPNSNVMMGVNIIGGLELSLQDKPTHGLTFENLYDLNIIKNIKVNQIHKDYIGYKFITGSGSIKINQSIILENLQGNRTTETETLNPVFYFDRCQEIQLVGCKAFPSLGNRSIPDYSGVGFLFEDCKGVTLVGCSSAFGKDGVVWHAKTKNTSGLSIVGHTNESLNGLALNVTSTGSFNNSLISVDPMRVENQGGGIKLTNTTKSRVNALGYHLTLEGVTYHNALIIEGFDKITDSVSSGYGKKNSIMVTPDYNNIGTGFIDGIDVRGDSLRSTFGTKNKNYQMGFQVNATDSASYGQGVFAKWGSNEQRVINYPSLTNVEFKNINGTELFRLSSSNLDNNSSGMLIAINTSSGIVLKQVKVDVANNGKRWLYIEE